MKQAFLAAADKHPGGRVGYLFKISKTHPAVFVQCLARMLPTQVKVEQDPNSIFMQALAAVRAREQAPQVLAGVGAYSYSQPRTNASGVGDPAIIDVTPETPDEQG